MNREIYVFETRSAIYSIAKKFYTRESLAYQDGVDGETARGYVMPWDRIPGIRRVQLEEKWGWETFADTLSTSEKGERAAACVMWALRSGRFPIWVRGEEETSREGQMAGADVIVCCNKKIQVKCDYRCGVNPNGTGNLFLQTAERNPLGRF